MTRVNLVDPEVLTKEHRLAEYKEIPRVFTRVLAAAEKGKQEHHFNIPEHYKIGKGHETFFYNKCSYVFDRFRLLCILLKREGVNVSEEYVNHVHDNYSKLPDWAKQGYTPKPEEIYVNMYRLANRLFFKLDNDQKDEVVLGKLSNLLEERYK
jgi:deoxyribonuclease (pyrimidine dimer)